MSLKCARVNYTGILNARWHLVVKENEVDYRLFIYCPNTKYEYHKKVYKWVPKKRYIEMNFEPKELQKEEKYTDAQLQEIINESLKSKINNKLKENKKEENMNVLVAELFEKTKDAVLVDKYFSGYLTNPVIAMLCNGKQEELLKMAQELEEKNKNNK